MAWVVRAEQAQPEFLMRGYEPHPQVPGLYGPSVQYEPGLSVDELALSGRFPNAMMSYEDETALAQAVERVGYRVRLVRSPGIAHHHTFCVITDATGAALTQLPQPVAEALSKAFQRMPNPHRVSRR